MEVDVNVRRIVDVKIPTLQVKTEKGMEGGLSYGFVETNASVDKYGQVHQKRICSPGICKGAEYENAIFSLAKSSSERTKS